MDRNSLHQDFLIISVGGSAHTLLFRRVPILASAPFAVYEAVLTTEEVIIGPKVASQEPGVSAFSSRTR